MILSFFDFKVQILWAKVLELYQLSSIFKVNLQIKMSKILPLIAWYPGPVKKEELEVMMAW